MTCASAPALRAKAPPFVYLPRVSTRALRAALRAGYLAPLGCGEHGGDPESVKFFHRAGLNYVSCSPFRVPVARLAAAQAAIEEKRAAKKK